MAGRKVEVLEGELGQLKTDFEEKISDFQNQFSSIHEKMDGRFAALEDLMKKMIDDKQKPASSETIGGHGRGGDPNPSRGRENPEVEVLEGDDGMPPLEPLSREELSRGYDRQEAEYVGRREEFYRRGAGFERIQRRGADFERGRADFHSRGADFERIQRRGADFERRREEIHRRGADFDGNQRRGDDFEGRRGDSFRIGSLRFWEGPNPVIFKSGNQRRKLSSQEKLFIDDGDILELIPGNHFFKYVKASGEHASSSGRDLVFSDKAQKQADKDALVCDRNHQLLQDEALARTLQNLEDNRLLEVSPPVVSKSWSSCPTSDAVKVSSNSMEAVHQFNVSKDCLSLVFRLMRVQGLPKWANECTVAINDVIEPQGFFRAISVAAVTALPFWLSGSTLSRKPCLVTFWQAATPIVGGKLMLSVIFCLSCGREIEAVLRGKLYQLCYAPMVILCPKNFWQQWVPKSNNDLLSTFVGAAMFLNHELEYNET
ncbi:hypothetical protein M5K25_002294 [Dendrobium thyrsiflorum]|uniref:Uncharacterized protein n=1 Tax=Dendrobium thyrsiflorum TaxID=117978 RepID=A0ABD0VU72_DENTH